MLCVLTLRSFLPLYSQEHKNKHKNTVCIGRSHGIHAEVMTFGVKICSWIDILERQRDNFIHALDQIKIGQISGPVGTYSNIDPVISNAMAKLPLIGAISKVVTFRTFEDSNNGFEADISIPKVVTENGEELQANKDISAYADKLIAQYESEIAAADGEGHYSISSTYETVYDGDRYLCLKVNTTLVMASGTEYVKIFTIDKTTGKTVMLKDLADGEMLKKISKNIISQMTEQMAEDENVTYFIGTETPEWDFNGLDGSESFYFDSEGRLVICFDEYQVAPGYMGAVEFTIPKEITGELQSH